MQPTSKHSTITKNLNILKMPVQAGTDEKANIFRDNLEHLQALEYEARLWLAIAYLKRGGSAIQAGKAKDQEGPDLIFSSITPDRLTPANLKEILLKVEAENRIKAWNSIEKGISLNFEKFCESYHLDDFERVVVMLLLANSTCMDFRKLHDEYLLKKNKGFVGTMTIGTLLSIISNDYREQLQNRRYFSVQGTLVKQGIFPQYSIGSTANILDLDFYLHERIIRYILGDNNTYNVSLQCITREKCTVEFDRVIIPDDLKKDVITLAKNYSQHTANMNDFFLKEFYGYGIGLVFLFHGPSGTGKTMLAHALAHSLGKELLSLKWGDAFRYELSFEETIKYIFKEARLTDAIVFFDECEDLIRKDSPEDKQFLIEIEKAECITILATNKVVDLDPSIERRITMKVPFDIPDEEQREKIWKTMVPGNVSLSEGVNFKDLAKKYIFTGGLIKNAIFMAINNNGRKGDGSKITLTPDEIEKAAAYQAESMFKQNRFEKIYNPRIRIEELPLKPQDKKEFNALASIMEKLPGQGMGINVLIGTSDIKTGIDCVEAVANRCKCRVRRFPFNYIMFMSDTNRIKDPLTQEEIDIMDYAFRTHIGCQTITLFVDYGPIFKQFLSNPQEEIGGIKMHRFWDELRTFQGMLFFITAPVKRHLVPVEFNHYIEIRHPAEELQIRQWENHLKNGDCPEDKIIELVERHPMHLHEIDHIARQATIGSFLKGREGAFTLNDVHEVIGRLKHKKETPILFGKD